MKLIIDKSKSNPQLTTDDGEELHNIKYISLQVNKGNLILDLKLIFPDAIVSSKDGIITWQLKEDEPRKD